MYLLISSAHSEDSARWSDLPCIAAGHLATDRTATPLRSLVEATDALRLLTVTAGLSPG